MSETTHPVAPEEVMAYLDEQVSGPEAARISTHLEQCGSCRILAEEFSQVSRQMAAWQVEPAPAELNAWVLAALPPPRDRAWVRPWVWKSALAALGLLTVVSISIPNLLRSRQAANEARSRLSTYVADEAQPGVSRPMLVRTASLSVVVTDLENARAVLESIAREQQGYWGRLQISGRPGEGRSLNAILRVPAERLDGVLAQLKKLGHVETESRGSEEITPQYVDLTARLNNARNTEQRLIQVLNQKTGKVTDILAVEKEIARVREEIERMQAERRSMEQRVEYASLELRLTEERKAEMEGSPVPASRQLWNGAVEGYRALLENALDLAVFLLRNGPSLAFWGLLLFLPGRFLWRRWRLHMGRVAQ